MHPCRVRAGMGRVVRGEPRRHLPPAGPEDYCRGMSSAAAPPRSYRQRLGRLPGELAAVADRALDRTVRLAVTGLSESGKTVFITALVHQLLVGRRLPFLEAAADGRLIGAKLAPPPDVEIPEFPYREFIQALISGEPAWPRPTDRLSALRIAIRYRPSGMLRRRISELATLHLEIVDYPGEWLLDLPLLETSYGEWSRATLSLCGTEPRASLARDWLACIGNLDPSAPADEEAIRRAARLYAEFLRRCRRPEAGLSLLQPGRLVMPGDLDGAPVLAFCPLPAGGAAPKAGSLHAAMAERFEAYKERVIRRFYRDHFSRFDRQIVLVDLLRTLNCGPESFRDMQEALAVVMRSFVYGRSGLLARLFRPRIDKLLFAATKADHVASNQHPALRQLLERMVAEAAREARFSGVETGAMAIASVKATETVATEHEGRRLSCVRGTPLGRDRAVVLFPGEVPEAPPTPDDWEVGRFNFLSFKPPARPEAAHAGLPHVNLDRALEFLIGDKLA